MPMNLTLTPVWESGGPNGYKMLPIEMPTSRYYSTFVCTLWPYPATYSTQYDRQRLEQADFCVASLASKVLPQILCMSLLLHSYQKHVSNTKFDQTSKMLTLVSCNVVFICFPFPVSSVEICWLVH